MGKTDNTKQTNRILLKVIGAIKATKENTSRDRELWRRHLYFSGPILRRALRTTTHEQTNHCKNHREKHCGLKDKECSDLWM